MIFSSIDNRAGIRAQIDLNLTAPKIAHLSIGRFIVVDHNFVKQSELIAFALKARCQ